MIEVFLTPTEFLNKMIILMMLVCLPTNYNMPDTMEWFIVVHLEFRMAVSHCEINIHDICSAPGRPKGRTFLAQSLILAR